MAMNPFGGTLGQYDQRAEREYYARQMYEKQQKLFGLVGTALLALNFERYIEAKKCEVQDLN